MFHGPRRKWRFDRRLSKTFESMIQSYKAQIRPKVLPKILVNPVNLSGIYTTEQKEQVTDLISELITSESLCPLHSEWFCTLDADTLNRHRFSFCLNVSASRKAKRSQAPENGCIPHHWWNRRNEPSTIVTEEFFGRSDSNRDRSRGEVSRDHQQHPRLFYPSARRDTRFRWLGKGPDRSWLIEGIVLVPCFPGWNAGGERGRETRWQIARHDPLKTLTWLATLCVPHRGTITCRRSSAARTIIHRPGHSIQLDLPPISRPARILPVALADLRTRRDLLRRSLSGWTSGWVCGSVLS